MEKKPKIIAVMPAYNAEKTLQQTIDAIPKGSVDEIILVDDASRDDTATLARTLGLHVIVHEHNTGYGGNQKTCYRAALDRGADIVVMLHPDYQYDPRILPYMTGFIKEGICDIMLANRIRTRQEAVSGGMPLYKYLSNRFLTFVENLFLGLNLGEYHTGYRAFSKTVLETLPLENNSDDFVFDQEMLIQAAYFGFKIGEVPVPAKYFEAASSINFRRSVTYGLATLYTLLRYSAHKLGIRSSTLFKKG